MSKAKLVEQNCKAYPCILKKNPERKSDGRSHGGIHDSGIFGRGRKKHGAIDSSVEENMSQTPDLRYTNTADHLLPLGIEGVKNKAGSAIEIESRNLDLLALCMLREHAMGSLLSLYLSWDDLVAIVASEGVTP
jgi:hypothetical protein